MMILNQLIQNHQNASFYWNFWHFFYRKVIVTSETMSRNIYKSLHDPEFHGTYIVPLASALQYNQLRPNNFTLKILKREEFATLSVVMFYQKNFFLAPAINEVIRNLQSGGLIEYWHFMFSTARVETEIKELEKLSLSHLKVSFEIMLIGSLISLIVFIAENVKHRIENHLRGGR